MILDRLIKWNYKVEYQCFIPRLHLTQDLTTSSKPDTGKSNFLPNTPLFYYPF